MYVQHLRRLLTFLYNSFVDIEQTRQTMKLSVFRCVRLALIGGSLFLAATATAARSSPWETVVNSNDLIPNIMPATRTFNSYNPPSVSANGVVVFRGRSTGHGDSTGQRGGPVSGIFKRRFRGRRPISSIQKVAARSAPVQDASTQVPPPNNIEHSPGGLYTRFIEFPAIPRISINTDVVATRGNHQPVWLWAVGGEDERGGTTGVYAELDSGPLLTGASLLGSVPGAAFAHLFDVPFAESSDSGIRFSVFPGAPSITDNNVIAFKGNFEDGAVSKTGVFFRQLSDDQYGGSEEVQFVASSDTVVPNPGLGCAAGTTFGSTAPPTAAGDTMVRNET